MSPDDDARIVFGIVQTGVVAEMVAEKVAGVSNVLARQNGELATLQPVSPLPALVKLLSLLHMALSAPAQLSAFHGVRESYTAILELAVTAKHQKSKAASNRRRLYRSQHGQCYRRPPMLCSSPLLLLCSGVEMRLLFAAPPSVLTFDHLFWAVLSATCRADLLCAFLASNSPCKSQVRCCNRL